MFVSDLQQAGGILWVLWFPPPIKLTAMIIITEILLKVALSTLTLMMLSDYYRFMLFQLTLVL